jgi:hypothetical protein
MNISRDKKYEKQAKALPNLSALVQGSVMTLFDDKADKRRAEGGKKFAFHLKYTTTDRHQFQSKPIFHGKEKWFAFGKNLLLISLKFELLDSFTFTLKFGSLVTISF